MSEQVQSMFSAIAPKYDVANGVLSLGIHRYWRTATVRSSEATAGQRILDCATGTGDLAIAFKKTVGPQGEVVGTDFCVDMLEHAPKKAEALGLKIHFEQADAQLLPYSAASFDVASIAFGIRNVDEPRRALKEMARVVRPGGKVVVLEFGQPHGLFGALFRFYSNYVLPFLGGLISGNRAAYQYLNRTAAAFPSGESFVRLMKETEMFSQVSDQELTFGTVHIYVGTVK